MRVVTVRIKGNAIDLRATWRGVQRIAYRVCDPWELAHKAARNQQELLLSAEAAASILHIAVTEAGEDIAEEEIGEAILKMGMAKASQIIGDYLSALVEGEPEKPVGGDGSKKK